VIYVTQKSVPKQNHNACICPDLVTNDKNWNFPRENTDLIAKFSSLSLAICAF